MARAKIGTDQHQRFTDPRDMPAYGIPEAAHYLRLPTATLRSWVLGRKYDTQSGKQFFEPVIHRPDPDLPLLSFFNLAEAHVLSAFRREHEIPLHQIRAALDYVRERFDRKHPLIDQQFQTDGAALFIEHLGVIVDASARGQIVMDTVRLHFRRLDFADNVVVRLWPFTHASLDDSPKSVFIDPRISFGRPSLARCHVPTAIIAERYKAGESIAELADDYGCDRLEIEEGLRCELDLKAAA